MMFIENTIDIGQSAYIKTDSDQKERIVTGIVVRPTGILYCLTLEATETLHYPFEVTSERDDLKAMNATSRSDGD